MRKLFALSLPLAVSALMVGCVQADDTAPVAAYAELDESFAQLRADFNRAKGSVRVLFVIDPICPGCLRGLDDVNRDLLAKTEDRRLQTFVVHVPVLGAKGKDIAPAGKLLQNSNVRHYWNPDGTFGQKLAEAVDLKRDEELVYAWDVWLIYGPEASWETTSPPPPRRLMHQLRALKGSAEFPQLDSEEFAQEVKLLLAQLPATDTGQ